MKKQYCPPRQKKKNCFVWITFFSLTVVINKRNTVLRKVLQVIGLIKQNKETTKNYFRLKDEIFLRDVKISGLTYPNKRITENISVKNFKWKLNFETF